VKTRRLSRRFQSLGDFLPRAEEITIDWRVLMFTIATTLLTSLAVGVLPAQRLSSISPRDAMGRAGTRASTEGPWAAAVRRLLLVGQIGIAVLLGTTAALIGRSFVAVLRADLGFAPDALLTFELSLPERGGSSSDIAAFYDRLAERLESRPQVTSVGALSMLPLSGGDFGWSFLVADKPVANGTALPHADVRIVTPGTLEALGVPLRGGRSFQRSDHAGAQPVAIVNETFAKRVWPYEDPIGKQVKLAGPVAAFPWMTVIGVAADVRFASPDRAAAPAIYRTQAQHRRRDMTVVVRTTGPPADVVPAVREEVKRLGGGAVVLGVREFTFYLSRSVAARRLVTILVAVFAAIAIALALVGVYGLFAYAVTSRTREIGLRIALGAGRARVVWMMMRQALLLGSLGLVLGGVGIVAARRLIETQLFEIEALDPPTLAVISVIVLTTALLACYVPARRAAAVDPATALRAD